MLFAKKIDRLMRMRGETQRSLAAALAISHRAVGGWLTGAKPHRGTALLIAEHFKVPVDDLLDDEKELPFERYLGELREDRERAAKAYPANPDAQMHAFDYLADQRQKKRNATRLRKIIAELADIAYSMDANDDRLAKIAAELRNG